MLRHDSLVVVIFVCLLAAIASAPMVTPALAQAADSGTATQPQSGEQGAGVVADPLEQDQRNLEKLTQSVPLEIDRLTKASARLQSSRSGLEGLIKEIEALRSQIRSAIATAEPRVGQLSAQIAKLGPAPKEGEPPESEALAGERQRLNAELATVDGGVKQLRLLDERLQQLSARIQGERRKLLTENLLQRAPLSLPRATRDAVVTDGAVVSRQLNTVFSAWGQLLWRDLWTVLAVLMSCGLIYGALVHFRDKWVHALQARALASGEEVVGFFRRVGVAAFSVPAYAFPRLALGAMIAVIFPLAGLSNWQVTPVLAGVLVAFAVYVAVSSLIAAVLPNQQKQLRLIGIDGASAFRIGLLVRLLALFWGFDHVFAIAAQAWSIPDSVQITAAAFVNILFAILLAVTAATRINLDEATDGGRLLGRVLEWLKWPAYLAAIVVIVATALGFIALGRFVTTQVMLIGIGGLAAFLIHRSVYALTRLPAELQRATSTDGTSGEPSTPPVTRVIRWLANALLVLVALPIFLVSWGFTTVDLAQIGGKFVYGFEVGGFKLAPGQILFAIFLFALLVTLTRFFQHWVRSSILTPQRVDPGLAHSIYQFIGYAGIALAALAGVSYAGFDVTNVAIVAGALSVGIGFGLQSIVNNFVSGLILLVERPIKVGDWIVVGENQGYVRRISVRSTEIETFDRASLILPNSDLISGTVQNWTHRNTLGRVVVPVGVSYDADPKHVISVLERVAAESDVVLKHPAPLVFFEGLGASSLDFTLRAYIANVNMTMVTKTQLLVAIVAAFRRENIEIPYPQQDVHFRDLDGIRSALTKAAMERKVREMLAPKASEDDPVRDTEDEEASAPRSAASNIVAARGRSPNS